MFQTNGKAQRLTRLQGSELAGLAHKHGRCEKRWDPWKQNISSVMCDEAKAPLQHQTVRMVQGRLQVIVPGHQRDRLVLD